MADMNELLTRIEKLESSGRERGWVLAGLIICMASLAVGTHPRKPGVVEVRQLVVKDASGNVVTRLGGTTSIRVLSCWEPIRV